MIRRYTLILLMLYVKPALGQHILVTPQYQNRDLVQWVDNKLSVLVEGHMCRDIVVKTNRGKIRMDVGNCTVVYTASDTNIRRTIINIGVKGKKGIDWILEMEVQVHRFPDPWPTVGSYPTNSSISKPAFLAQVGISVPVEYGGHLVQVQSELRITHYSVKITRADSTIFELQKIEGFMFPKDLMDFIRSSVVPGDEITFFNIDTLIFEKEKRSLKEPYIIRIK